MKVLVDTNVLLDVALEREPHVEASAEVFDALEAGTAKGLVTSHSLATFYYLLKAPEPVDMIRDLLGFLEIAPLDTASMRSATELRMKDFEDAMQAMAALASRCTAIVTRNVKDFRNAPVRAVAPAAWLKELP